MIAATVKSWLASPEKLKSMQEAARKAARPAATLDIAREIGDMLLSSKREKNAAGATSAEKELVLTR